MTSTVDQGHDSYGDRNRNELAAALENVHTVQVIEDLLKPSYVKLDKMAPWRAVADKAIELLIEEPKPIQWVWVATLEHEHNEAPMVVVGSTEDAMWDHLDVLYGIDGVDREDLLDRLTDELRYKVSIDRYEVRTPN